MNAMAESRKIISDLEQVLSDQIGGESLECPVCGAQSGEPDSGKRPRPLEHFEGCALMRARRFLGREA